MGQPAVTNPIPTLAALREQCSNHVAAPRFQAAAWGVKVRSLDTGRTLFEHDAQKLLSPASNSKLFTVALGFDRLGSDYRIRTSLLARARPDADGNLQGDLILVGRGDPGFQASRFGGELLRVMQPLVAVLTNAGVRRIQGDLVADESFLIGPPYGAGWAWEDLNYYYGAPISALSLNDNCATLTARPGANVGDPVRLAINPATSGLVVDNLAATGPTGAVSTLTVDRLPASGTLRVVGQLPLGAAPLTQTVPVAEPAAWFGRVLRDALTRAGVEVTGEVRVMGWIERSARPMPGGMIELAGVDSAPFRELAGWIMKPSQNLHTDLLLGHMGSLVLRTNRARAFETSEAAGVRELGRFLRGAGIPAGAIIFEEGSGLSRNNLVSADATVRLLEFMDRHRWATDWRECLPVAGVDGTVRRRMTDTPAQGNVRAKTGTLRWANSLSGYVTTLSGERLAFSLMLNRYQPAGTTRTARDELDTLAVWLASFSGRSE